MDGLDCPENITILKNEIKYSRTSTVKKDLFLSRAGESKFQVRRI